MTKLKKEKTGRLAQTGFLSSEATGTARWSRCLCGKVYMVTCGFPFQGHLNGKDQPKRLAFPENLGGRKPRNVSRSSKMLASRFPASVKKNLKNAAQPSAKGDE
jgi:hypothetical protein